MIGIKVGPDEELLCPHCGSISIHHEHVKVFSRSEDEEKVAVTTITPTTREAASITSVQTTAGKGNPSSRRHGLSISFRCEQCPEKFELDIAQHKGSTYVSWKR
ncbi:MAG: hypothetical protein O9320_14080 [Magnetospirillum sp.]|nr:hypothetical protein [Magnetospirillum sp.]